MKRYFLFAFYYEAQGGINDLKGMYDTLDEAKAAIHAIGPFDEDDGHVVDMLEQKIVCRFGRYGDSLSGQFRKYPWTITDVSEEVRVTT
jgi:hypothetical protein